MDRTPLALVALTVAALAWVARPAVAQEDVAPPTPSTPVCTLAGSPVGTVGTEKWIRGYEGSVAAAIAAHQAAGRTEIRLTGGGSTHATMVCAW